MRQSFYIFFILTILFCILDFTKVNGQLVINELMSNNTASIEDQDGDFRDWIELYNNSDASINILNYTLSDSEDELNKWTFPEIIIPPQNFLLIFASGKDKLDANELHTNFKISSIGESLFLSNSLGQLIDQIEPIALSENQSYGRSPDGSDNLILLNFSTPSNSNNINNKLTFTFDGGFYTDPFYQKITSITSDSIYYTIDGSIPTENSNLFIDSLMMDYKHFAPNVISNIPTSPDQSLISIKAWESPNHIIDKANILRYASYKNGIRTSEIYTHTYVVNDAVFEKYDMPVISLVLEADNLFDPEYGIHVPGIHYDTLNPGWTGNYFQRGDEWERPVHIEYYEEDGQLGFSQNAGIRIHGGKTRQGAQKSFKLYARNEYGKKYFDYPLMPHREHIQYKRFLLRTTMGTWYNTLLNDVFAHEVARGIGINYQDYRPAVVFINGEYWGILTIRDRIDERYLAYSYGLDKDSVEFRGFYNLPYFGLINFIEANDLSEDVNYDSVKTKVDIENFIDYHITQMFFQNTDWPVNNMRMWIEKNSEGKWKWVFYDIDGGFSDFNFNMFEFMATNDPDIVYPNSPSSTFMFRHLMKNQSFRDKFKHRYIELLNTDFRIDTLRNKLNQLIKLYESEIPRHFSRWYDNQNFSDWKNAIDESIITFMVNRSCAVEKHLADFFDLPPLDLYCVDSEIKNSNINFLLAPNPNNGNFFLYNNSLEEMEADIIITNIIGQTVHVEKDVSFIKNEKKYFNFSNLPNDTYILTIRNADFSEMTKFILIH